MQKSILNRILVACAIIPMVIVAQTSVNVPWTGTPGEMETFIHGDTTSTGEQAHDIYVLEANKVYLQLSEVNLHTSCELVGAEYADGDAGLLPAGPGGAGPGAVAPHLRGPGSAGGGEAAPDGRLPAFRAASPVLPRRASHFPVQEPVVHAVHGHPGGRLPRRPFYRLPAQPHRRGALADQLHRDRRQAVRRPGHRRLLA